MVFEKWQIICLVIGGGIWIVFSILTAIRNSKARKAKKVREPVIYEGEPGAGMSSFHIDPNPEGDNDE